MNTPVSPEFLAQLGLARIAYVRPIRSDDVSRLFPQAPPLPSGLDLYALIAADGSPIMVTDTAEQAFAEAFQNELATVSLH